MIILKTFVCVVILITSIYFLVTNIKIPTRRARANVMPPESIETSIDDSNHEEDEYISFRLLSGGQSKVWDFKLSNKLVIIGRSTDVFKGDIEIGRDRTFSREHLGIYKDKSGRVHFNAIKGDVNPVFVSTSGGPYKEETGSFVLEPGTYKFKMGSSEFEVYFRSPYEEKASESIKTLIRTKTKAYNVSGRTRIMNRS